MLLPIPPSPPAITYVALPLNRYAHFFFNNACVLQLAAISQDASIYLLGLDRLR